MNLYKSYQLILRYPYQGWREGGRQGAKYLGSERPVMCNHLLVLDTGRNVRFACLQIYCKSCYKFQICNDLPHLHACKLLICTRGKLGGKCGNGREAVRRKSVANPLQTNYFATSLHACKFNANTKFASDLHIRKSVYYIKLANGLQTCKLVANMKFAIGLHHVLYVRKLVANNKFASDLHIRKCVDYTNYTKPLV